MMQGDVISGRVGWIVSLCFGALVKYSLLDKFRAIKQIQFCGTRSPNLKIMEQKLEAAQSSLWKVACGVSIHEPEKMPSCQTVNTL